MIYLDSAATTLQKPPEVAMAATRAIRQLASPGRGGHRPAMEAAKVAFSCREEAAALFHVPTPEQVVFTASATHGLNLAIGTLVRPGARVALSGYEHNAVTRPLHARNAKLLVARAPLFRPEAMVAAFREQLDLGAEVAVCTHVSNVFGYILPMEEIARLCRERGVPLIVDASQSAGALPLDFQALGADFVAMPGHKGLYGDGPSAVRPNAGAADPGGHGQRVCPPGDARLSPGPGRAGDPQPPGHRRTAGGPALCPPFRAGDHRAAGGPPAPPAGGGPGPAARRGVLLCPRGGAPGGGAVLPAAGPGL